MCVATGSHISCTPVSVVDLIAIIESLVWNFFDMFSLSFFCKVAAPKENYFLNQSYIASATHFLVAGFSLSLFGELE
jgi:hypothetical protein